MTMGSRSGGVAQPKALHVGLLRDLLSAALNARGFSEKQRWELHQTAELVNRGFLISPLAAYWPFQALGRKRGIEEDVVEVGTVFFSTLIWLPILCFDLLPLLLPLLLLLFYHPIHYIFMSTEQSPNPSLSFLLCFSTG